MVGHTGKLEAAVQAVETLDDCLARIVTAVREAGGTLIVTADHGNAEQMWDPEANEPHTAHTCNPVPVILVEDMQGHATARRRLAARRGADDAGDAGAGKAEGDDGGGSADTVRDKGKVE